MSEKDETPRIMLPAEALTHGYGCTYDPLNGFWSSIGAGCPFFHFNRQLHVTCVLCRDPFTPPASWAYTVWITLEDLPATGRIVVGSFETHDVTYQMAPRPVAALVSRP